MHASSTLRSQRCVVCRRVRVLAANVRDRSRGAPAELACTHQPLWSVLCCCASNPLVFSFAALNAFRRLCFAGMPWVSLVCGSVVATVAAILLRLLEAGTATVIPQNCVLVAGVLNYNFVFVSCCQGEIC